MKILVNFEQHPSLSIEIDSKLTLYHLLKIIYEECLKFKLPEVGNLAYQAKELEKSDLHKPLLNLFGEVEAAALRGNFKSGCLSWSQIKNFGFSYRKKQRTLNFCKNQGLTFFDENIDSIIYEYYFDHRYVLVRIPEILGISLTSMNLKNWFSRVDKTNHFWSLLIDLLYQMIEVTLSSTQKGQILPFGQALLQANTEFIELHEDLDLAKMACKTPIIRKESQGQLVIEHIENYNFIFCFDSKELLQGIFYCAYNPAENKFNNSLEWIDFRSLTLNREYLQEYGVDDISEKALKASFANHILKKLIIGNLNYVHDYQGGTPINLEILKPSKELPATALFAL